MKRCKHVKPNGEVVDGCGFQGDSESHTCQCGGMLRSVLVDAQIAETAAALERARVVGVLDAWAVDGRFWQCDGDGDVQLFRHCDSSPMCFGGTTPDAARAAAAAAIEKGEV